MREKAVLLGERISAVGVPSLHGSLITITNLQYRRMELPLPSEVFIRIFTVPGRTEQPFKPFRLTFSWVLHIYSVLGLLMNYFAFLSHCSYVYHFLITP